MTPKFYGLIVRNGKEYPLHHLNFGDQVAYREYDALRQCYIFHILTEVPPSDEVVAAAIWVCDEKGHRFEYGNQCCMECGETYEP